MMLIRVYKRISMEHGKEGMQPFCNPSMKTEQNLLETGIWRRSIFSILVLISLYSYHFGSSTKT